MIEVRPIDADVLQERLKKKKPDPAAPRYDEVFNDALLRFKSMVHSAPTVEPERKKGKWIHKPDIYLDEQTWECSECGEPWIFIEGTPSENNANFCPNCGADMRGEQE